MASSSSTRNRYDVFISFRGEDIRDNFLSHLVTQLENHQIDAYVDYRLGKGEEISTALVQAIQDSFISLVIFSQHYATSKWCLDELVKILECMEFHQRLVIPVFYKVDPSDVRHQRNTYEEAFHIHQHKLKGDMLKVETWRSALTQTANLSGFHYPSNDYRNESKLIEEIVKAISEKLSRISSSDDPNGLVGIDENLVAIESLLGIESDEVRVLGIWGMGGLGKTTIAEVVFEKYSSEYEGCCFLENVREESQRNGLSHLFKKLVSELLEGENVLLKGPSKARSMASNVRRRLSRKKVFIVLDDVSTVEQLEHLIGEQVWLGAGSRVIVTTRDMQTLMKYAHDIYEVKNLDFENSLRLFCLNAFHKVIPETGYEEMAKMVVDNYCKGVPLALKVLGCFLHFRSMDVWKSAITKLEIYPNKDIFNVLKLSYDGLDDDSERSIFLDIAFFFKGKCKNDVIRFLDSCNFFGEVGIDNLVRKALINVSRENRIEMHDLIQQMGWEIDRQESIKNGGRRSRLRNPEDVYNVLKNNRGTDLIEGIMVDISEIRDLYLHPDTFKNMPRLRFLKFYTSQWDRESSNVHGPATLGPFSDELRYLEWRNCPLESLPSNFCAEKLVVLRLSYSKISKLWDGVQDIVNLKAIELYRCDQLVELPDFSKASKLKSVNLTQCSSLRRVHPSILSIDTLEQLCLPLHEESMKRLECDINLESLLDLCLDLRHGETSEETIIDRFCFSFTPLSKLTRLLILNVGITKLPNELCLVTSLEDLGLTHCKYLTQLPHNMKALTRLHTLTIDRCHRLRSLPELPLSVILLHVWDCRSLETVVSLKAKWGAVKRDLIFGNCKRLNSVNVIEEDSHLTLVHAALYRFFKGTRTELDDPFYWSHQGAEFRYTGSSVPKWFLCQTRHSFITLELQQPLHHLLGFFFCCVLPPSDVRDSHFVSRIEYRCYLGDGTSDKDDYRYFHPAAGIPTQVDHVFVHYDPHIMIPYDHCTSFNQKISFEFISRFPFTDRKIKECGVHPIYVSDIPDFVQKMMVESELDDEFKEFFQTASVLDDDFEDEKRINSPSEQQI